jgi:hypothetical protein
MYCFILNRRIQTLQDSKSELAALLKNFDDSTIKASETIVAMQTASKKIGDNIQLKLDKANYLLDDLSYAIEKGGRLTSQIEASFAVNRARSRAEEQQPNHPPAEEPAMLQQASSMPEQEAAVEKAVKSAKDKKSPASIEAILEKVVSRKQQVQNAQAQNTAMPAPEAPPARSRAEQDLIELIRSSSKG